MSHLILINGYAGAGKDTFVKFFTEEFWNQEQRTVSNLSSISPVWKMLKDQGIDMDAKGPAERKLAAEVKAALDNYDFYATRLVLEKAYIELAYNDAVFIHMREPRALEYSLTYWQRYAKQNPIITLFVERPQEGLIFGNVADDSVRNFKYDWVIMNDGSIEELRKKAKLYANLFIP